MSKLGGCGPKNSLYCSFCGKSQQEVRKLIAGPTVFICDECVELCMDVIREENKSSLTKSCDGIPTAVSRQAAPGLVSKVDPHDPIGRLKRMTLGKIFVAGLVALFGGTIKPAHAQFPYPIPPPPPPIFNPSTPYTMPPMWQTPIAPGLPSRVPNSSLCSTFDLGPCFPQFLPPIGQDLRLTIVSTDDNGQRNGLGAADQG